MEKWAVWFLHVNHCFIKEWRLWKFIEKFKIHRCKQNLSATLELLIRAERKILSIVWQQHWLLRMCFSNSTQILLLSSEIRTGMAGFEFRQVKEIFLLPEWTRQALALNDQSVFLVPGLFPCGINDRSLMLTIYHYLVPRLTVNETVPPRWSQIKTLHSIMLPVIHLT